MRKSLSVLLWLAVIVASGSPAIAHNCHQQPQYSVADGNHTHASGTCAVSRLLRPRLDSKEKDGGSPEARKERGMSPPDKGPVR
jgi:hypothetical protein